MDEDDLRASAASAAGLFDNARRAAVKGCQRVSVRVCVCDEDAPPSPVRAASTTTLCIRKPPSIFRYSNPNAIGDDCPAAVQQTSNASAVASRRGVDVFLLVCGLALDRSPRQRAH